MGRLASAWKALFGRDESDVSQHAGGLLHGVLQASQAPRRGTRELLQAYKRLPYLHSAARRIAGDVASIPWAVYGAPKVRGKYVARSLASMSGPEKSLAVARAVKAGELRALDSHPFLDVLAKWNPYLGSHESQVALTLFRMLVGQGPVVLERNAMGLPLELWPVPPHWITDTPRPAFPYYRASYMAWSRDIPEADILWLRRVDPEHPYSRGTGVGEALADELDVGELRAKYAKNFFHNDATPAGIVSVEGASPEERERFKASWEARHRGPGKNGRMHFTNAKVSVSQLTQTLRDMQLSEQRAEDRRIIQEVLNIPPELMGVLENANRSTIDVAEYLYAKGVLVPEKDGQCAGLQALLSEYDERLVLGYVSPVPADREFSLRVMTATPSNFKVDEWRGLAGDEPLEGGLGEALYAPPAAASPFGAVGLSAKADPPWARRAVGKAGDPTSAALAALAPESLSSEVGPVQEEEFQRWAQAALEEVGVKTSFDMRNPLVRQALERAAGERIRLINDTTRDALRAHLSEGVAAGEGINELEKRVADVFDDADGYRSRRIARTEVVGLSNRANIEAWRQSGVVEGKEWLSVRDGQTRDSHRELDGQTRALDEPFSTSAGRKADAPGQFGIAEEDINCRCAGIPVVANPTKAMDETAKVARWKAYDEALVPWEDALEAALRRGFKAQREAVLAALRRAV